MASVASRLLGSLPSLESGGGSTGSLLDYEPARCGFKSHESSRKKVSRIEVDQILQSTMLQPNGKLIIAREITDKPDCS